MKKYKKHHPDKPLPHITPHVFRHTFCTGCAEAGLDLKRLQYLMGHSDAGVTLNVYTHANYAHAADQMTKIMEFCKKSGSKKKYVKPIQLQSSRCRVKTTTPFGGMVTQIYEDLRKMKIN